jgi:hypothetical protein
MWDNTNPCCGSAWHWEGRGIADTAFHFDVELDPTSSLGFGSRSGSSSKWCESATSGLKTLHSCIVSIHGSRVQGEPLWLLKLDSDADPAFRNNEIIRIHADPHRCNKHRYSGTIWASFPKHSEGVITSLSKLHRLVLKKFVISSFLKKFSFRCFKNSDWNSGLEGNEKDLNLKNCGSGLATFVKLTSVTKRLTRRHR